VWKYGWAVENTISGEKMCDPHASRDSMCAERSGRSFEHLCTCEDQPKRYPMCEWGLCYVKLRKKCISL